MNRLLQLTLNLVIMASIAALSAAALVLAHWGVLRLLSGAAQPGSALLAFAATFALAAAFMIRNRNDLADR